MDEITCDDWIREEALLVIWLPSLGVDFGGIAKSFKYRAYALYYSQTWKSRGSGNRMDLDGGKGFFV
jgi:hypothetical protein